MRNKTVCFVSLAFLLFLGAGIVIPAMTGAQEEASGDRVTRLERRVANLEARVAELEKSQQPRVIPVSGSEQRPKKDKASWRSLEKGMTKDQVKKILGEPTGVMNFNESEIWDYASGGSVRFDRSGRVLGWYEP
jgi:hypothetical protein